MAEKTSHLKKIIIALALLLSCTPGMTQPGRLAGGHKKWIGKEVDTAEESTFFKGYSYNGGLLLQQEEGTAQRLIHYSKGSTHILLFCTQVKDSLSYTLRDILEVKGVKKGMHIQTGSCSSGGGYSSSIIALTQGRKHLKAWWVDKDRLKISKLGTQGINCFVDGL